jgi:tetratricopeptide (TPR) repeat protein
MKKNNLASLCNPSYITSIDAIGSLIARPVKSPAVYRDAFAPVCMTICSTPFSRMISIIAICLASLIWTTAWAQSDYAKVQNLITKGQMKQALEQADAYITEHPNDPQMRFIKAGALQKSGRTDQAEAMLVALTTEYPELAEPWNNLAVLYAGRGQIDAAKLFQGSANSGYSVVKATSIASA